MKLYVIKSLGVNTPFQKKQKNNNWNIKLKNYMLEKHIPDWTFGFTNAKLVFKFYTIFSDIFSLLTYVGFEDDLCLFKYSDEIDSDEIDSDETERNPLELNDDDLRNYNFFKSNLSQKNYFNKYISKGVSFSKFVQSSFFMYLSTVFKNKSRVDLTNFAQLFSKILIANILTTKILFQDLLNLGVFSGFPLECIQGFNKTLKQSTLLVASRNGDFRDIEKIHKISRFLEAFPFYFSKEFSLECIEDCNRFNSFAPLLLAFKIYEIKLVIRYKPLWKKKCDEDFVFFQKSLINNNYLSKKNLHLLMEKNNNFYNYE